MLFIRDRSSPIFPRNFPITFPPNQANSLFASLVSRSLCFSFNSGYIPSFTSHNHIALCSNRMFWQVFFFFFWMLVVWNFFYWVTVFASPKRLYSLLSSCCLDMKTRQFEMTKNLLCYFAVFRSALIPLLLSERLHRFLGSSFRHFLKSYPFYPNRNHKPLHLSSLRMDRDYPLVSTLNARPIIY